ncbi:MAG: hypothetical protein BAJALOKI3v1_1030008 [Promethearchaeota archaeon]|nr:MAG: hypothetical protein BAJALOKI3v1_1030008 [Candidatus Lokiarchaeota archaeon]
MRTQIINFYIKNASLFLVIGVGREKECYLKKHKRKIIHM